ncbi:hypothetical protein KEM48_004261 [Puccinia striiformis f. sp. tritici PST-130]|nr:hypothetical protein KEM48_004261 [Puccinia striiformis f. sp. tritici PST-130]
MLQLHQLPIPVPSSKLHFFTGYHLPTTSASTPAIPAPNGYLNSHCRPAVACQGPWPGAGDIHRHVPAPHSQPRTLSSANIIAQPNPTPSHILAYLHEGGPIGTGALHNTENNIGQRNKDASQIYKQRDTTAPGEPTDTEAAPLNPSTDPNAEERSRFGKIFKSEEKIRAGLKEWPKMFNWRLALKELSDSYGVEGFLVLAAQDHRKPFSFQGGSLLGDEYLRGLVAEEDPIRKFAVWVTGAKKLSKKRKITGSLLVEADATRAVNSGTATEDLNVPGPVVAAQPPPKRLSSQRRLLQTATCAKVFPVFMFMLTLKRSNSHAEWTPLSPGKLSLNHSYISEPTEKQFDCRLIFLQKVEIQAKSPRTDKRGWPGTDTTAQLAVFNCDSQSM